MGRGPDRKPGLQEGRSRLGLLSSWAALCVGADEAPRSTLSSPALCLAVLAYDQPFCAPFPSFLLAYSLYTIQKKTKNKKTKNRVYKQLDKRAQKGEEGRKIWQYCLRKSELILFIFTERGGLVGIDDQNEFALGNILCRPITSFLTYSSTHNSESHQYMKTQKTSPTGNSCDYLCQKEKVQ